MVEFESPIGKMNIDGGPPPRRFAVSDESDDKWPENPERPVQRQITPEELMEMRAQQKAAQKVVPNDVKRRVELLVGIGRGHLDVPVDLDNNTMVCSLRTLKGKEMREIVNLGNKVALSRNPADIYQLRLMTLVYSLHKIDNVHIDDILDIGHLTLNDRYDFRSKFIDELDDVVISYLFEKYQNMLKKNKQKYGIATAEDAKEVAAQTNKSGEGTRS